MWPLQCPLAPPGEQEGGSPQNMELPCFWPGWRWSWSRKGHLTHAAPTLHWCQSGPITVVTSTNWKFLLLTSSEKKVSSLVCWANSWFWNMQNGNNYFLIALPVWCIEMCPTSIDRQKTCSWLRHEDLSLSLSKHKRSPMIYWLSKQQLNSSEMLLVLC